jgi:hypothetical protein
VPLALLLLPLLASAPPPPPDAHFIGEERPDYFFLVVGARDGNLVRQDDSSAVAGEAQPPGDAMCIVLALAGLESGALSRDWSVTCDSTCWAEGQHGEVQLVEALAVGCDTYFREARRRVSPRAVLDAARRAGFGSAPSGEASGAIPDVEQLANADTFPGPGWLVTAGQWVRFWQDLSEGKLCRSDNAALLLHACAQAVQGPGGYAYGLSRPRRMARALLGGSPEGAWATGMVTSPEGFPWIFALFVRGGSPALAAARADRLLEETRRTVRRSTSVRGGYPLPELPPPEERIPPTSGVRPEEAESPAR